MQLLKKIVSLCSFFLLFSCAVQVKTYQNSKAEFSKFSSWCWMQGCEVKYQGPEFYFDEAAFNEISNAVAWNMYDKGYVQGDDQSDLIVNYYIIMEEDSAEISDVYEMMFQGNREWLKIKYPEYHHYLKGSLVIDVIDRVTSDLIWTSTAVKYLEMNPAYDKEKIWEGVHKAMKKFPRKND